MSCFSKSPCRRTATPKAPRRSPGPDTQAESAYPACPKVGELIRFSDGARAADWSTRSLYLKGEGWSPGAPGACGGPSLSRPRRTLAVAKWLHIALWLHLSDLRTAAGLASRIRSQLWSAGAVARALRGSNGGIADLRKIVAKRFGGRAILVLGTGTGRPRLCSCGAFLWHGGTLCCAGSVGAGSSTQHPIASAAVSRAYSVRRLLRPSPTISLAEFKADSGAHGAAADFLVPALIVLAARPA